jgi:hypothetical protein
MFLEGASLSSATHDHASSTTPRPLYIKIKPLGPSQCSKNGVTPQKPCSSSYPPQSDPVNIILPSPTPSPVNLGKRKRTSTSIETIEEVTTYSERISNRVKLSHSPVLSLIIPLKPFLQSHTTIAPTTTRDYIQSYPSPVSQSSDLSISTTTVISTEDDIRKLPHSQQVAIRSIRWALDNNRVLQDNYEFERILGWGTCGVVVAVTSKADQKKVRMVGVTFAVAPNSMYLWLHLTIQNPYIDGFEDNLQTLRPTQEYVA